MNQMAFLFTMALLPGALATLNMPSHTGATIDPTLVVNAAPVTTPPDKEAKDRFSFMTHDPHDRDYHKSSGANAGLLGGLRGLFGQKVMKDRPVNATKEEIVKGHYCQKPGIAREQTYYASSFCYWIPEGEKYTHNQGQTPSGLSWSGDKVEPFDAVSTQNHRGKCVKSSYCHNNARGKGGDFHASGFIEEIEVGDCKKEADIDRLCQDEFNTNAGEGLKTQQDKCKIAEDAFTQAVAKHDECLKKIESLSEQIDAIPGRIIQAEKDIEGLDKQIDKAREIHKDKREAAHRLCNDYAAAMTGISPKNPLQVMAGDLDCNLRRPAPKVTNDEGVSTQKQEDDFKQNTDAFNKEMTSCNLCKQAFDSLKETVSSGDKTNAALMHAKLQPDLLRKQKKDNEGNLEDEKRTAVDLQSVRKTTDEAWTPQKAGCLITYEKYDNGVKEAVIKCAPTYHPESCELSCWEKQAAGGCGVVESLPEDVGKTTALGGVKLQCMPPQPSWILNPSSDGKEIPEDQCNYLKRQEVQVQYALSVLKEGWLSKESSGLSKIGFRKGQLRYFVLESGDEVRSAVLRYFAEKPKAGVPSTERGAKGIILQDATSVSVDHGDKKCFTLVHFYRTYHFCVEGEGGKEEAENWRELIHNNIGKNIGSSSEGEVPGASE